MCNERVKRSDLQAEIERLQMANRCLQHEIDRLRDDALTAAYHDGVEYGKRMMATQVEKIAMNNWLGGK